jgi:transcriptional regulator with XRE-family HTH domain
MKLGEYLKQSRKKSNLTLREVEREIGISNAYVCQLEYDKIKAPSPKMLHKLSTFYNISYEYLLELAGYPFSKSTPDIVDFTPASRIGNKLNDLTEEEEKKLEEYLQFLRSRGKR